MNIETNWEYVCVWWFFVLLVFGQQFSFFLTHSFMVFCLVVVLTWNLMCGFVRLLSVWTAYVFMLHRRLVAIVLVVSVEDQAASIIIFLWKRFIGSFVDVQKDISFYINQIFDWLRMLALHFNHKCSLAKSHTHTHRHNDNAIIKLCYGKQLVVEKNT